MRRICVIGVGYVGLTTGTCFADLGNQVICVDIIQEKIAKLNRGEMPIYEPGLEELVTRNVAAKRLTFTTDYATGLRDAEFIFIAVATPAGDDGEAELKYVRMATETIAQTLTHYAVIVNKSTVPVGTGDSVEQILTRHGKRVGADFDVVSNPEFLREGSAVYDFMQPDRVVLGAANREAAEQVAQLYLPLRCAIMVTDLRTAEMIKYASNAFLATRISFINEIANICEKLGADVKEVAAGMGMDKRIGKDFLDAGIGYGGSCFPKDVQALAYMAEVNGSHPALLRAVMDINRDQRARVIAKLRAALGNLRGKIIGVWGLAFKPNTDDIRDAPALDIIHLLQAEGARVRAYDPVAINNARQQLTNVEFCADAYATAAGADAVVLVTHWNEFKQLDMARVAASMKSNVLIDGRNIYEPARMKQLGFKYSGMGRGNHSES
ncbi:MAG: UDP-glucose/GDP-mannose dehydrogenase family protein [Chloroflexi bacterium]|nr:UDP-glucose/GDP-mannose dehydrogenase family protein [Chloroflexota bacterium]